MPACNASISCSSPLLLPPSSTVCLETFISYLYHVSCSQSTNEVFSAEFFNNLKFGRSIAVPTSLPLGRSMTYSSAFLLLLLNTDIHHIVSGHVIAAPQTLSRRIPSPFPSATVQPYNRAQTTSSFGTAFSQTGSETNTITAALPDTLSYKECLVGYPTLWSGHPCTFTKIGDGLTPT